MTAEILFSAQREICNVLAFTTSFHPISLHLELSPFASFITLFPVFLTSLTDVKSLKTGDEKKRRYYDIHCDLLYVPICTTPDI